MSYSQPFVLVFEQLFYLRKPLPCSKVCYFHVEIFVLRLHVTSKNFK